MRKTFQDNTVCERFFVIFCNIAPFSAKVVLLKYIVVIINLHRVKFVICFRRPMNLTPTWLLQLEMYHIVLDKGDI